MTASTDTGAPTRRESSPPPLVSVIMSSYDRPQYLEDAVRSVLAQTCTDLELIVIDDASPNDPTAMLASIDDFRIRFIRQDENLGIAGNVTDGMRRARGRYVTNVHDDDLIDPEYLSVLVAALEADPDSKVAFCDHRVIDAAGDVDERATCERSHEEGRATLSGGRHQPFWDLALVHRTVFLGLGAMWRNGTIDFNEVAASGDHWDNYALFCLSRDGGAATFVPRQLGSWRAHPNSNTVASGGGGDPHVKFRTGASRVYCYSAYAKWPELRSLLPIFRREVAHGHGSMGVAALQLGDVREARGHLIAGLRVRPDVRCATALLLTFLPARLRARASRIRRDDLRMRRRPSIRPSASTG